MSLRCRLNIALCSALACTPLMADDSGNSAAKADRGRYLVQIAGCNDCHTAGWADSGGTVAESEWLKGDALGWRGPWGTTYASNLRLTMANLTEDQWVAFARNLRSRPPMPSFNLNHVGEDDPRAIYAFVRGLQPVGEPAPSFLPPGQEPPLPYVIFPAPPPE